MLPGLATMDARWSEEESTRSAEVKTIVHRRVVPSEGAVGLMHAYREQWTPRGPSWLHSRSVVRSFRRIGRTPVARKGTTCFDTWASRASISPVDSVATERVEGSVAASPTGWLRLA